MHVVIAKVNEVLFEGEAESLTVPGSAGEMTVLSHHEPFITTLKHGRALVRLGNNNIEREFNIEGGILEITPTAVTVVL